MKNYLNLLLGLVLVLALSEITLRALFTPPLLLPFVAHDHILGHRGPAGKVIPMGRDKISYTELGHRQLPTINPPGSAVSGAGNITWVGDSMVEAISIGPFEHFASQVAGATGANGQLVAAGDWGTTQELLALREFLKINKTNMVVLLFSSLTDFVNNHPAFAGRYQSKVDFLRPYAATKEGEVSFFYLAPLARTLRRHSHLFLHFDNARISRSIAEGTPLVKDCRENPNSVPFQAFATVLKPEWEQSVQITAALLRQMKEEAAQAGANFLAVYLPNDFELLDERWRDVVLLPHQNCFPGTEVARREIENKFLRAAKLSGVNHVSLYDYFFEEVKKQKGKPLFLEDGHFNATGHFLLAKVLSRELTKGKFIQSMGAQGKAPFSLDKPVSH
jgi:hypothetical protein